MKIVKNILLLGMMLSLLAPWGCKNYENLVMQRNRIFLLGRLNVGAIGKVRLIYRVAPNESSPTKVVADLSAIGGAAYQEMADTGNGIWRWSGYITPFEAGGKKVLLKEFNGLSEGREIAKNFQVFNTDKAIGIAMGCDGVVLAFVDYAFALKADGTVAAWMYDSTLSPPDSAQSIILKNLTDVVAIAAGYNYSIALKGDGSVVAWDGCCGGVYNTGLDDVVAISSGWFNSLALKADGTVMEWENCKCKYHKVSKDMYDVSDIVGIASGKHLSLALKGDGTVAAWGFNIYGEPYDIPEALQNMVQVAAGSTFNAGFNGLALEASGNVVTWGWLNYVPLRAHKRQLSTAIAAGDERGAAINLDGSVTVWWKEFPPDENPYYAVPSAYYVLNERHHTVAIAMPLYGHLAMSLDANGSVSVWKPEVTGMKQWPVPEKL